MTNKTNMNSVIKINKGIPIPEPLLRGRPEKYPFRLLKKGDSFAIPHSCQAERALRARAYNLGVKLRCKFSIRTMIEDSIRVLRVWRVS